MDTLTHYMQPILTQYLNGGKQSLPERECFLLAAWLGDSEIMSGGFEQFYLNATGELACELVDALVHIEASEKAQVVSSANALFAHSQPPLDHEKRLEIINSQSIDLSKLKQLSSQYSTIRESVEQLLLAHT